MSIILSAYVQNAFCEFLLPAVNNTDTQIVLKKNIFAFSEDVILELEVVEKEWFIKIPTTTIVRSNREKPAVR